MKPIRLIFVAVSLASTVSLCGQAFVNLDFDSATIKLVNPGWPIYVATVPGWTWYPAGNYANGDPNSVIYDNIALDGPLVTLHGMDDHYGYPAIDGGYSILLQGGSRAAPRTSYAAIWQTGQIPSDANSMLYYGGALQVSFNGVPLTSIAIDHEANFNGWAVDISAFAGQTGELRFTKYWRDTGSSEGALLDDIGFSPVMVPEPNALALYGVSLGLLLWSTRVKRPTICPTRTAASAHK